MKGVMVFFLGIIALMYFLNIGMGFIELIPDNIPFVGNLDEGVAVMLILAGVVEAIEGRKIRSEKKQHYCYRQKTFSYPHSNLPPCLIPVPAE